METLYPCLKYMDKHASTSVPQRKPLNEKARGYLRRSPGLWCTVSGEELTTALKTADNTFFLIKLQGSNHPIEKL
jgi:hypothetical protein